VCIGLPPASTPRYQWIVKFSPFFTSRGDARFFALTALVIITIGTAKAVGDASNTRPGQAQIKCRTGNVSFGHLERSRPMPTDKARSLHFDAADQYLKVLQDIRPKTSER
jgi:hypothetical protein